MKNGKTDKERLTEIVEKIYRDKQVVVEPLRDRILVRLLPKSHATASKLIITPDVQNKVVAEAVVLATFKPYYKHFRSRFENYGWNDEEVEITPSVSVGDHILISHYVGAPVDPLDAGVGEFRMIKDEEILMRIDYEDKNAAAKKLIDDLCDDGWIEDSNAPEMVNAITENFHVVRKDMRSLTTSGA